MRDKLRDNQHSREWKARHPGYMHEWRKAHPDYARRMYDRHSQRYCEYTRKYIQKLRSELILAYGGACVRCGNTDTRVLQIDHVNGGGVREKGSMCLTKYLKLVLASVGTGKYQLLCANCNWIKRHENNEIKGGHKRQSLPITLTTFL